MKNRMFSLIAFVVASIIWTAESAVHFFIQIQLLKTTALETENFDQEAIELFDQSIDEASNLIDRLSHVENVTV